jgi:hypothetical protein
MWLEAPGRPEPGASGESLSAWRAAATPGAGRGYPLRRAGFPAMKMVVLLVAARKVVVGVLVLAAPFALLGGVRGVRGSSVAPVVSLPVVSRGGAP